MAAPKNPLIQALLHSEHYPHPVAQCQLLETHISWVILTGDYAYKIKKPLDLGFLDFTQLAARRHFCQEELRLNQRLAPGLYLAVIPIAGSSDRPRLLESDTDTGADTIIDYAVKMRQFPQSQLATQLLHEHALATQAIVELAQELAAFHAKLPPCHMPCEFGSAEQVLAPMQENFHQLIERLPESTHPQLLRLRQWTLTNYHRLTQRLNLRQQQGHIRECHGDAHLGNMVCWNGRLMLFDCLEFDPALRWIDTISEVAFVLMDLEFHRRPDLAAVFLNQYLEISGDYTGVTLLRFYQVYRALVRAKVASIDAQQHGPMITRNGTQPWQRYLDLAKHITRSHRPALYLMHGFAASGKTTIATVLASQRHTIRLRSDVERKRLHGLAPLDSSHGDIYQDAASERTYRYLAKLARELLLNGYSVIVDACFLMHAQRRRFQQLAQDLGCQFMILDVRTPTTLLHQRLQQRRQQAQDASEATAAVLQHQIANHEPLDYDELRDTLIINTDPSPNHETLINLLHKHQRYHGDQTHDQRQTR